MNTCLNIDNIITQDVDILDKHYNNETVFIQKITHDVGKIRIKRHE